MRVLLYLPILFPTDKAAVRIKKRVELKFLRGLQTNLMYTIVGAACMFLNHDSINLRFFCTFIASVQEFKDIARLVLARIKVFK